MDQFLSQMTMQMTAPKVSTPSAPKGEAPSGQDNQFQKLVDQKCQDLDSKTSVQQPGKDQEGAVQEEAPVQENIAPTNEQMLLVAAYAAAQVVIVPAEEVAQSAPAEDNMAVENLLEGNLEGGGTAAPVAAVEQVAPVVETAPIAEEPAQTFSQASQAEVPVQEEAPQEISAEVPKTVEHEAPVVTQQSRPVEQQPEQPKVQDTQTADPVKKEQPVQVQTVQHEEEAVQSETAAQPQPVFREVEAAPVKVGEASQAQEMPEDSGVKEQVGQRIGQALQQGETKVELQLNPASLGTVRVELTRSSDGAIHIVMNASSTHTQALLERHAAGLQSMLGSHSQEVHVEVQHQENPNAHQQPNYDGHNGQPQQEQEGRRQQQKDEERRSSQDFLQQLRLGLIPME